MAGFASLVGGAGRALPAVANRTRETNVREEALALEQKMAAAQAKAQQDELARQTFQDFLGKAIEVKEAGLVKGTNEADLAAAIVPFREMALSNIEFLAKNRPGSTPEAAQKQIQDFTAQFDAQINSVVSPLEAAASEGKASVAAAGGRAEALKAAGIETTLKETAGAAGLIPEFKPFRTNIRSAETGDVATFVVNNENDKATLDRLLASNQFVESSKSDTVGRFSVISDPVSERQFIVDTTTGDVKPLRSAEVPESERPKTVGPEGGAEKAGISADGTAKAIDTPEKLATATQNLARGGDILPIPAPADASRQPVNEIPVILSLGNIGFPGKVTDLLSGTVGQVVDDRAFSERGAEKQRLANLRTRIKDAMKLSSRPPLMEQEQLQKRVPDPDAFFANPEAELGSIGQLALDLQRQVVEDSRFFNDRNNSPKLREEVLGRIKATREILDVIGVVTNRAEDVEKLPPGTIFVWVDSRGGAQIVQKNVPEE